jgi:hypothetical protein
MPPVKKSRTSKKRSTIITFATVALVVAGLGVQCGRSAWQTGSVISAIGAVALLAVAGFLALGTGLRSGPCPKCGKDNTEVAAGHFATCLGCREYLTGDGNDLWLADPATIAEKPVFGSILPERFSWPEGCAVCQKPHTRTIPASITVSATAKNIAFSAASLALGRVVVRSGGERVYSVDVPHCATHNDGAALENPTIGGLRILFRSYPYSRAFRERNNAALD